MKASITLIMILFGFGLKAQQLEVEGKMTVRDINTIATFQSSEKNSFIRLANNDDPNSGTNVGYFNDPGGQEYFFIDTPFGEFGEFRIQPVAAQFRTNLEVYGKNIDHAIAATSPNGNGLYARSDSDVAIVGNALNEDKFDFLAITTDGSNGYGESSSIRWKTNIIPIDNPIEKLGQLRGVYFDWKKEFGGSHTLGFIAEEVGAVLPEIVVYEENGVDATGMDYSKMTPLLVEATNAMRREYQQKFNQQQSELDVLKQEIIELRLLLKTTVVPNAED